MCNDYSQIFVMQTGGWIGDMVLLTPTLRAIKQKFPDSRVELMVTPLVSELMSHNPYIDDLIVYDKRDSHKGIYSLWKISQKLRKKDFQVAFVLHPTSIRSAFLAWLARIPERLGTNIGWRKIFLTNSIDNCKQIHEVKRYLKVMELVGIYEAKDKLEFWHTDEHRNFARKFLKEHGVSNSQPLIGINIGTTWNSKQWAVENFAEIIDRLDANVLVTGSSSEKPTIQKIHQITKKHFIDAVGKTDIFQLAALIECCEHYITCDSGPMHISAAVGTHTIALFGPTDAVRHRPYGEANIVIEKPIDCRPCYKKECHRKSDMNLCMNLISPDDVIGKLVIG